MSSSSSENERDTMSAQLQPFSQEYPPHSNGRSRSMSPLILHRDKVEYPSIDIILNSFTPVNSVSTTNPTVLPNTTRISYNVTGPVTRVSSLPHLCEQQEELYPRLNSLVEPRPSFEVPIRSVGQRIGTWPPVSGSSTRTLQYQEAIRLVRDALDCSSRGQFLMEQDRQLTGNLPCGGDNSDVVPDAGGAHPPLTIRRRCPRGTENVRQACVLDEEPAAFCQDASIEQERPAALNGKETSTLNHLGYQHANNNSHYASADDTANVFGEAPIRTLDLTEEPPPNTSPSPSLTKSKASSPHWPRMPSVSPDSELAGYRPRIGRASRRDTKCTPHAGTRMAPKKCPNLTVDARPPLTSVRGGHDASSGLVQNTKLSISPTRDDVSKHDQTRAKRSSCHDM